MSNFATVFATTLVEVDPCGANRILRDGISRINPLSLYRNQNAAAWLRCEMLVRELSNLTRDGHDNSNPGEMGPEPISTTVHRGNLRTGRFLFRCARQFVKSRVQDHLYLDQWVLGYAKNRNEKQLICSSGEFRVVQPPPDRAFADPFVVTREHKTYIFFEDFRWDVAKGVISCVEVDEAGNYTEPIVILEKEHHLSYPFLFEWEHELFLVPETVAANRIEAYRAIDFPYRWCFEATLIDQLRVVDSTLLERDGKWWLFASGGSTRYGALNQDLHLFYAETPFGRWTPHPKNPVVCDVRRARPAGQLITIGPRLIRPAQDCAKTYGHATVFNDVQVLSETDYRESPAERILPNWCPGQLGIHTFNCNEQLQVVDLRLLVPREQAGVARVGCSNSAKLSPRHHCFERSSGSCTIRNTLIGKANVYKREDAYRVLRQARASDHRGVYCVRHGALLSPHIRTGDGPVSSGTVVDRPEFPLYAGAHACYV
jgi:hypothetical protein